MNWNSKSCSDVAKEQIWKEYVRSEQQSVRIFDQYRSNSASLKRHSIATPVSSREADFLNKSKFLFRSIYSQAGISPVVQQQQESPLSTACSGPTSPFASTSPEQHRKTIRSPSVGVRSSTDGGLSSVASESPYRTAPSPSSPLRGVPPVPISYGRQRETQDEEEGLPKLLPPCGASKPPKAVRPLAASQSPARPTPLRPTSGSEYGAMLEPLVKHRLNPFHYGIRKSDVTRSH